MFLSKRFISNFETLNYSAYFTEKSVSTKTNRHFDWRVQSLMEIIGTILVEIGKN